MEKMELAEQKLRKYHQEHILPFLQNSNEQKKEELIDQILQMDIEEIMHLYEQALQPIQYQNTTIEPVVSKNKETLSVEEKKTYTKLGEEVIKRGEYAVATMAGGQGTRLGCHGPKGKFKLDVGENGKYLFEILAENLILANNKYETVIPWHIMTSKENNQETVDFFMKQNYFGYPKEKITFFTQGELPLISKEGKLFIGEDGKIKEASDGNGGIFTSLKKHHLLEKMEKEGTKWIFIGGVDNVLLQMADPMIIGLTIAQNNSIGAKSTKKAYPSEKVGVYCKKNGKPAIIEYTEFPGNMAEAVNDNGELLFGDSNIMCNLFHINCLKKIAEKKLPYHKAFKKANYLEENGNLVEVTEPNAFKFESFMFDSFDLVDNISILCDKREENFAPVKNAEGKDSPETAKALYEAYWNKKRKCEQNRA